MTLPQDYRSGPAGETGTSAPFGRRFALGGVFLSTSAQTTINPKAPAPGILMMDGSHASQRIVPGKTAPRELGRPLSWAVTIPPIAIEADRRALALVEMDGQTVTLYLEQSVFTSWRAGAGDAAFSLPRRAAYGEVYDPALGAYVSHSSHPPRAWLDGVEQEVISSGTPSAGQVRIPDAAGAQWRAVETPPLSDGQILQVEYMPVHDVVVTPRWSYQELNNLVWSATLEERLTGRWD